MSYTLFSSLKPLPDDPILGLNEEFKKDARPEKVNLGVGVYLTEEGKLPRLKTVETAEERLLARQTTHGYTAMSGNPLFCDAVQALVFGDNEARQQKRICTIQTLGGTGALRLGAELAYDYLGATNGISKSNWVRCCKRCASTNRPSEINSSVRSFSSAFMVPIARTISSRGVT